MGGVMVVPQSDSETQFLLQLMPEPAGVEGSWIWIDCNDLEVEGRSNFSNSNIFSLARALGTTAFVLYLMCLC